MKHRAFLRRTLPAAVLAAVLCSGSVSASAFSFFGNGGSANPAVAAFSKNGPVTDAITFSRDDFQVEGNTTLESMIITKLPDSAVGALTLGGQLVGEGDVVSMAAVDGLRFTPLADAAVSSASFTFTPIFGNGTSGEDVTVGLYLLKAENSAPIAENLTLSTYKNVAITGQFAAVDPDGDLLTFQLLGKPARGAVTMPEDGSTEFVYTPYENKTGKDSFTYIAIDAVGNASAPATVKIKIEKAKTTVTYADMGGNPAYKASIRLAEEGILVGECMGGGYFFRPDAPVSRSEFVAMAMETVGLEALEGIERTGFADDAAIPTWAKAYVSSALKSGLVQGTLDEAGQVVFNAEDSITCAEAAVLLDRALQVTDVTVPTLYAESGSIPVWACQSAANLQSCGVLRASGDGTLSLSDTLTRADAAQLLCGALEVLDNRESSTWFLW